MRGAVRRRRSSLRFPVLHLSILMHLTRTRCACEASVSIVGSSDVTSDGFPPRVGTTQRLHAWPQPVCTVLHAAGDAVYMRSVQSGVPVSCDRHRRLHAGGRRTGEACSVHAFAITPGISAATTCALLAI